MSTPAADTPAAESPTRAWWRRVPLVLVRPREAFSALRSTDPEDLQARQEPILLVVILAGMAGVWMSPTWGHLFDDPEIDALLVAVLTFVGGGIYGVFGYYVLGLCVYLGARGLGSTGTYRLARHVVGLSAVPLALSFFVVVPLDLIAFGSDAFRRGGADEATAGTIVQGIQLAFVAWSLGLLAYGVRVVYELAWLRVAAVLGIATLFLAAFVVLTSGL